MTDSTVALSWSASTATSGRIVGYRVYRDGTLLRHAFTSRLLSDDELDAELAAAGLRRSRALDEHGTWIEAAPHARPR